MNLTRLEQAVERLRDTPLDWRFKGFGPLADRSGTAGLTPSDLARNGVRLAELGSPMMTIDRAAVDHNLATMAAWCAERGVTLAPHGKTTMAPALWLEQLQSGSVAITVANAFQLRVARAWGVPRVIVANELIGAADLRWLAAELAADPDLSVLCWVDSVEAVRRMDRALKDLAVARPIEVCIEVGAVEGRAGVRDVAEAMAVADAVVASPVCRLVGVSGFEGAVPGADGNVDGLAAVDRFVALIAAVHRALEGRYETDHVVVTAGGSAFFDRVLAGLGDLGSAAELAGTSVELMLRSGAYVVHDSVHYEHLTPSVRSAGPELRPAIHAWVQVLSRPQPDLILVDAGKRDLPYDLDLPVVLDAVRAPEGQQSERVDVAGAQMLQLNDQHGFIQIPSESALAVGDVLKLGLSHPCTAFDKWGAIAVVDSADGLDPRVVDVVLTYF